MVGAEHLTGTLTVDPGWPAVGILALLLLGPIALGAVVGDLIGTALNYRDALRADRARRE